MSPSTWLTLPCCQDLLLSTLFRGVQIRCTSQPENPKTPVFATAGCKHAESCNEGSKLDYNKRELIKLCQLLEKGHSLSIITFVRVVCVAMPRRFEWQPKEGQDTRVTLSLTMLILRLMLLD
jgi:hypothetical protein